MTDSLEFSVRFTGDDKGLRGELRVTEEQLERLRGETTRVARATRDADRASQGWRNRLGPLNRDIGGLRSAIAGLGLGLLINDLKNAGLQSERWMLGLRAATGDAVRAADELAFVRAEAERLGLEVGALADNYTLLVAASKGTNLEGQKTRDIFTAVAEAARVYGLSADQTRGALNAVQQMMSKGNVQAEELRGQLGERLPGAFQIAARAMGVTTAELGKMLESGEVIADEMLPRFAAELRRTIEPGVQDAISGTAADFARMDNSLRDLKESIAASGLLNLLADGARWAGEFARALGWSLEQLGILERELTKKSKGELMLDLQPLENQANTLREQIGALDAQIASQPLALSMTAGKRLRETRDSLRTELDQVVADIARYQERLGQMELGSGFRSAAEPTAGTGPGSSKAAEARQKEAEKAERDQARALERLRASIQPTRAAVIQYEADLALLKRRITDPGELAEAMAALRSEFEKTQMIEPIKAESIDAFKTLRDQSKQTRDTLEADVRQWTNTFSSALARTLTGAEVSWSAMLHNMATALLESQLQDLLAGAVGAGSKSSGGGLLGSLVSGLSGVVGGFFSPAVPVATAAITGPELFANFPVGVAHTGGVAGALETSRMVPPGLFAGAPRYHNGGIVGDEVPAILRRGEVVSTPEQYARATGGVTVNQTITIDATGNDDLEPRLIAAMQHAKTDTIATLVSAVNGGGPLAQTFGRRR